MACLVYLERSFRALITATVFGPTSHRICMRIVGADHPTAIAVTLDENPQKAFGRPNGEIQSIEIFHRLPLGPSFTLWSCCRNGTPLKQAWGPHRNSTVRWFRTSLKKFWSLEAPILSSGYPRQCQDHAIAWFACFCCTATLRIGWPGQSRGNGDQR